MNKKYDITLYVKHFYNDELETEHYTVYAPNKEEVKKIYRIGTETLKGGKIERVHILEED